MIGNNYVENTLLNLIGTEMVEDINKVIDEIIRQLSLDIFKYSQTNLIEDGSIDTGFLLRSGIVEKEGKDYFIHYKAPYARIIEEGANTIIVSPEELEGWVRRKLGIKDSKENLRVSGAISKKLKERGLEGTFFLTRAIDKTKKDFKGKI